MPYDKRANFLGHPKKFCFAISNKRIFYSDGRKEERGYNQSDFVILEPAPGENVNLQSFKVAHNNYYSPLGCIHRSSAEEL